MLDINNWDLIWLVLDVFFKGRSCTTRPVFFNPFDDERNDCRLDKVAVDFVDKSKPLWLFMDDSQSETPESPPHDDDVKSWRLLHDDDFDK